MRIRLTIKIALVVSILAGCNVQSRKSDEQSDPVSTKRSVIGQWVRMSPAGPVGLDIKEDGTMEADFGIDESIEVITTYELLNDTICFRDKEGEMCPDSGFYKIYLSDHYLAFDLIDDMCNGRIKSTTGFWTKPDHEIALEKLEQEIKTEDKPDLRIERARVYMALGKSEMARADLDIYLKQVDDDARAYLNRAATQFPLDMEGVVADCDQAIALDPTNKNAYFMKGLALYEIGEREVACENFTKAIDLGFSILRIVEFEKCEEFWLDEDMSVE